MPAGLQIGSYEIVRELARGGQGVVYLAHDRASGHPRALKVLLEHDDEMRARFRHEARALANLRHPGLPRVYDLGEHRGVPYLVQELIEGDDLRSLLEGQGPFPASRAAEVVRSLAATLDYVHDQGLVHRDLKPQNVLVERRTGRVVLLDFGMLHARRQQAWATLDRATLTAQGEVLGTPAYMAPEQVDRGLGAIDRRTDVYALGGTLYTLLTGAPPFSGTVPELLERLLGQAAPDPRTRNPAIPAHLAQLCLRCLAKTPAARPASAGAVAAALDAEQAPPAAPVRRWPLGVAFLALTLVTGGLATASLNGTPPASTPPPTPPAPRTPSPAPPTPDVASLEGDALRRAAEGGDAEACYRYARARLVAEDGGASEALPWFEAAAEEGVVSAMNEVGRHYEQGLGVLADLPRSAAWFERAAGRGDPVGQARLGFALLAQRGVPRDDVRGRALLEAAGDHPEALYRRGLLREWLAGDQLGAIALYERAAAGDHGDAWSRVGHLLSTQEAQHMDLPRALDCYREGARLGSCHAIHGLARLLNTEIPGRVREPERSLELYERSARLGVRDSSLNLASSYLQRGEYVRAREHARTALDLGQALGALVLARIYELGLGVEHDPLQAWGALLEGARLGDATCAQAVCERLEARLRPPSELADPLRGALSRFQRSKSADLRQRVSRALETLDPQQGR